MKIRAAQDTDLGTVVHLNDVCGLEPWSLRAWQQYLGDACADLQLGICRETGKVNGFYLAYQARLEYQVLKLAVSPESRRRGMGTRLLDHAFQKARDRSCSECILEVRAADEVALAFYRNCGFHCLYLRNDYYRNPPGDAWVMLCRLEDSGKMDDPIREDGK